MRISGGSLVDPVQSSFNLLYLLSVWPQEVRPEKSFELQVLRLSVSLASGYENTGQTSRMVAEYITQQPSL